MQSPITSTRRNGRRKFLSLQQYHDSNIFCWFEYCKLLSELKKMSFTNFLQFNQPHLFQSNFIVTMVSTQHLKKPALKKCRMYFTTPNISKLFIYKFMQAILSVKMEMKNMFQLKKKCPLKESSKASNNFSPNFLKGVLSNKF